jgi:hypothetical protein
MTLLQIASIFATLHDADANTMAATRRCSVVNLIYYRLKLVAETTGRTLNRFNA